MKTDTDEMLKTIEELRQIPVALKAALMVARAGGLSKEAQADLLFGTGRITVVLRQVADEVESMMRQYESDEASARRPS